MYKERISLLIKAARPHTLPASAVPVIVATALAYSYGKVNLWVGMVCLIFAVIAQICANFANDYFDFRSGVDAVGKDGRPHVLLNSNLSPSILLKVGVVLMTLDCILGCSLIYVGGWSMLLVGLAVVLAVFMYSAGPFPLAYRACGEIAVIIFYGIIPVGFTFYLQTGTWTLLTTSAGLSFGLASACILIINNYRDRETDKVCGKHTIIGMFGEAFGRRFYLVCGCMAFALCGVQLTKGHYAAILLPTIYLIQHIRIWRSISRIREGAALNTQLARTARNVCIFGVLFSLGLLLGW